MSFPRYPAYKDSGVEWLGEVPAHWVVTRLKRYVRLKGGYAFSADDFEDDGIKVVRMNGKWLIDFKYTSADSTSKQ